jgi:hypothetical protein
MGGAPGIRAEVCNRNMCGGALANPIILAP